MRRHAVALVLLFASVSSIAHAQTSDRERAEAHFSAGRKLRANKHCDLAIDEFKQSIELEPGIGAHLNLGDCYELTGKLVEAFGAFKAAETLARREDDPRLDEARKSGARIEARLVRVVLRDDEPDLRVTVDGASAGAKPWTIVVTPDSDHTIAATTPDGRRWEEHVHGTAGDIVRLTPVLATPGTKPSPPRAEKTEPSKPLPLTPIVTAGVGAAALVAGSIFGGLAISARSDLADAFTHNPSCSGGYPGGTCAASARDALQPIEDRASFAAGASTVCFIAGAALLATGALLYLFSR